MNQLNLNAILNREENVFFIKQTLAMFDQNKSNNSIKKGIYIYG